ncbi:MAG: S-methyl-5-thioribose-1-phosphate isomerase [Polyangiaceae bacterium]|nr:S-methyl-5-thioribose-1-phosphate isomerase [Polyangiaceae bacterium]MCW5791641.1 S-methyl-5-thioribose-1-phosphate isomerase [Polyangiaceae bacterium]
MPVPHESPLSERDYSAVELCLDDAELLVMDQRELPEREVYLRLHTLAEAHDAIRDMAVRGAPAIGVTAAYAMALAARAAPAAPDNFLVEMSKAAMRLNASRPTAVNLSWATARLLAAAREVMSHTQEARAAHLAEVARELHRADVRANRRLGALGAATLEDGMTVLTHCNAGALATGGYGTALGVIRAAASQGKRLQVIAAETRPYLQGARLTAWELQRDDIPVRVVCDSAVASLLARGLIHAAVVGADRVAANGDVANKVGTYSHACALAHHGRPLLVAAPWSTVDLGCPSGAAIPIEERAREELATLGERQLLPHGVGVLNPSFDVTPAALVHALVTERGVASPVTAQALAELAHAPEGVGGS